MPSLPNATQRPPMSRLRRLSPWLLFILLGAAHSLSFAAQPLPTFVLPYVQLLSLTILLYLLNQRPQARARIAPAFFFGLGNFGLGLYWIYISLHVYGELPAALAVIAVLLFAALLSLFYVLIAVVHAWLSPKQPIKRSGQAFINALLWASLWALAEWLRGTLFTGFPWLNIGYAHIDGTLAGWAIVLGTYGVSWMAAFTAAALACFFQLHRQPSATEQRAAQRHSALAATQATTQTTAQATQQTQNMEPDRPSHQAEPDQQSTQTISSWQSSAILIAAFFLNLGGLILHGHSWSQPTAEPFFVRLTQGNVPQSMKFDPQRFEQGVQTYYELAALGAKDPDARPEIIILPETVIPVFQNRLPAQFWQQWIDLAAQQNSTLIMGVPLYEGPVAPGSDQTSKPAQYTNSAIAIDGRTTTLEILRLSLKQRYDKQHLVPFGEFIPTGFRWFIDLLNIPLGDFQRGGSAQAPFSISGQHIAPDICYEDVFGEEIIRSVRPQDGHPGATMLVNISNLGWFGDTWALRQHLQISRMRALETARPMIRATNTGITAVIDPSGLVRAMLPQHTVGVLDVEVQGYQGQTPYVRWGNHSILISSLVLIAIAAVLGRRRHTS